MNRKHYRTLEDFKNLLSWRMLSPGGGSEKNNISDRPSNTQRLQEEHKNLIREDLHYVDPVYEAYLLDSGKHTSQFLYVLSGFFVILFLWAYFSPVEEVTRGTGEVVPISQLQVVQSVTGGVILKMFIAEGDRVEKGALLAEMDANDLKATLNENRVKLFSLQVINERLRALSYGNIPDFDQFDTMLAQENDLKIYDEEKMFNFIKIEKHLYHRNLDNIQVETNILKEQLLQEEDNLTNIKHRLEILSKNQVLHNRELAIHETLFENKVVPEVDVLRLRRQLNEFSKEIKNAQRENQLSVSKIREMNEKLSGLRLSSSVELLENLNKNKAEEERILQMQGELLNRLAHAKIQSPVKGVVHKVHKTTSGGFLMPGEVLFEIVPLDETLRFEARVSPKDIAFIRLQQESTVKVTAYDSMIYGSLKGKVVHISSDTITDEKQGETYYRVIVSMDKNYVGSADQPRYILPGMIGTAEIKTGIKTVWQYLIKPILRAQGEALRER